MMSDKDIDNKNVDNNDGGQDNADNLLRKFGDSLSYLAKEVYETSKNAYDKALQSLEKWLLSKKEKVQEDTIDALGKLRDAVDKGGLYTKDHSENTVAVNKAPLLSPNFSSYDRSPEVKNSIAGAAIVIEEMIGAAPSDDNVIASSIGKLMEKIWDTEG